MNHYAVVNLAPGKWAIEWRVDGVCQCILPGSFDQEAEALFNVYELARLEFWEGGRRAM